jgi:hypothetical protein
MLARKDALREIDSRHALFGRVKNRGAASLNVPWFDHYGIVNSILSNTCN